MHQALAVAVGDPHVAVAAVALLVDGDTSGREPTGLIDRQIRPLNAGHRLAVQRHLDGLAILGSRAGLVC